VTRGNETVGGTSIMGLMMLAAGTGTLLTVRASGPDAIDAMDALCNLVSSGFGEDDY
jgi:phosphocarrier protein HPr